MWRKLSLAVVLLAGIAHAQFIGYTSSQSTAQAVFTNQASNGVTPILTNLGASAHFVLYCNTGFTGTIRIEASPDGSFSPSIILASASWGGQAPGALDSNCHVLQAGGYYQTVHVRITNYAAGSLNAWYTSVGSPISFTPSAFSSNGPTAPVQCDQNTTTNFAPSTANTLLIAAGQPIYVCSGLFSLGVGTPTDGLVTISVGPANCSGGSTTLFQVRIEASTPQVFPLGVNFKLQQGNALCMSTGANTVAVMLSLSYAQGPFAL